MKLEKMKDLFAIFWLILYKKGSNDYYYFFLMKIK